MAADYQIPRFDVVFVADPRFEGGTSTAMAVEIRAAARAGLRTGLLAVKGPIIRHPLPTHTHLRALIDAGVTERLDPDMAIETDLLLVHHPSILENYLVPRPRISAEIVIVVLHHPVVDRRGTVQYDLERVVRHGRAAFGRHIVVAPVSPMVRQTLPNMLSTGASVFAEDWTNLIELDEWPRREPRPVGRPVVIGRHSRPDIKKWPDRLSEALQIYPTDGERYVVHILGGGDYLSDAYGPLPVNWKNLPFSVDGVPAFLKNLDFFVYFHSSAWSEAFGRTILEALAVGLVCILPRHFEGLFGDAALYCRPLEVRRLVDRYSGDPALYRAQSDRARAFVESRYDAHLYSARLNALRERTNTCVDGVVCSRRETVIMAPLPERRCLFVSSNGIGMGHLVQQMALADRLPPGLEPVFATMSYAMKVAVDAGYQCHHFGHHHAYDAPVAAWNRHLAEELFDLVTHLRPSVLAYDATALFTGVLDLLATFPDIYSIWVRRPMWTEDHRTFLENAAAFDAIVEPGELADDFDHGPTKETRDRVYVVPPVLRLSPEQRLGRDAARRLLKVSPDVTLVALQLGSGTNYQMGGVRDAVINRLLACPDVVVLELCSPIRAAGATPVSRDPRHRIEALFPAFRYSTAFDACVSAAGYNAFHENVLGAVPTLFVPNEAEAMDRQIQRARWAELCGYGWLMRRDVHLPCVGSRIERLLDRGEREAVIGRCQSIPWNNGAEDIARFIEDHARIVRADRDVTRMR